jgi:hypothetical protein
VSDLEFSEVPEAAPQKVQGITFATKKKELSAAEEDELLNLAMIKKWEANHPDAASNKDKANPPG